MCVHSSFQQLIQTETKLKVCMMMIHVPNELLGITDTALQPAH